MNEKIKKISIIIAVVVIFIIIFFPKLYATSGGFAGFEKNVECQCLGKKFDYTPKYPDAMTSYFCAGIPISCKCLDEKRC
ncbi:MAG: hypothetical protein EPN86_05080 [Nanoarchaeota archaeon]|nr:MAG: hypothetical protein EPN86_05080 [Nanoarchaeota archaeon]